MSDIIESTDIRFSDVVISLPPPTRKIALWSITDYCNIECQYCYGTFGHKSFNKNGDRKRVLTADSINELTVELVKTGISRVYISGGEPLTQRNFWEIVETLSKNKIEVIVTTNATALSKTHFQSLLKGNLFRVTVSLDSLDERYHNLYREKHARVIANLSRLLKEKEHLKLDTQIGIYTVLTKNNIDDVYELLRWAAKNGVNYYSFQPIGLPKSHPLYEKLTLTKSDWPKLKELIEYAKSYRDRIQTSGDVFFDIWEKMINGSWTTTKRCFSGKYFFYIDAKLRIARCPSDDVIANDGIITTYPFPKNVLKIYHLGKSLDCNYLSFVCLCLWELLYPYEDR